MSKIPKTDSIEELARFWDTHDLTEFEDEMEEVQELVFDKGPQSVMRIRLRPDEMEALKRIAESRGVNQTDLVKEWVSEKLRDS
ncbi:MAG: CopG family antitoxin [Thermodesulfobacteriota bacterium]